MTDPDTGRAEWNASNQTIPLVPDAGFALPNLPPLPEETLVDPIGPVDPWSSGPGLGQSVVAGRTQPAPTQPTVPPAANGLYPPASTASAGGYGPPSSYPKAVAEPGGYGPASGYTPAPLPQQAPVPATTYAQPPYASYAEPDGPAAAIGNSPTYSPYAASSYAGQPLWPGAVDPVAYDYGYGRPPAVGTHPSGAAALVMGILGLVAFAPVAPIAWYLGARGRREMRAEPNRWLPSPMLTAGMVMGIIGTVLMVFAILGLLLFFAAIASS